MRQLELSRFAPLGQDFPVLVEMSDFVDVAIGDEQLLADDQQAEWIPESGPDGEQLSVRLKHLYTVIAPVCNVDAIVLIDSQTVRGLEFTLAAPLAAPLGNEFAVMREMDDSAVPRIGYKEIAFRADNDIVRRAEMGRAGAR